jgi:predicted transcriptional regulator with HTH domain
MSEESFIRISEVARAFIVDPQTLRSSLKKAGVKVYKFGERCHRIRLDDYEALKANGLSYYNDKIPCKK